MSRHSHAHHGPAKNHWSGGDRPEARIDRVLLAILGLCGVVTLVGLIVLWPSGGNEASDPLVLAADPIEAVVRSESIAGCSYDPSTQCRNFTVELTDGPSAGTVVEWEQGGNAAYGAGDEVLVVASDAGDGTTIYSFYDHQRGGSLLVLVVVFAVAVVALGRWRGLGALAGLAASLGVVVMFMVPSLLDGNNAVVVAVIAASTVAFIAIFLAHGFNLASTVALLSTFASLAITALLAFVFVGASKLTGLTEDATFMLDALGTSIDARGILLAGILIGSLGVLDDVTVTQVSTVGALRAADPTASTKQLFTAALGVGRDHISSTVNTLFLAYVGAALPLLLLFTEAAQSIGSVAAREIVATEIVRALVGSIGLVAAVPIATALAATVYRPHSPGRSLASR